MPRPAALLAPALVAVALAGCAGEAVPLPVPAPPPAVTCPAGPPVPVAPPAIGRTVEAIARYATRLDEALVRAEAVRRECAGAVAALRGHIAATP